MKRTWKFLILFFGICIVIIMSCFASAKIDFIKQHDLNKDGEVNFEDVIIMADNWLIEKQ